MITIWATKKKKKPNLNTLIVIVKGMWNIVKGDQ
jgi:hypothetical protein